MGQHTRNYRNSVHILRNSYHSIGSAPVEAENIKNSKHMIVQSTEVGNKRTNTIKYDRGLSWPLLKFSVEVHLSGAYSECHTCLLAGLRPHERRIFCPPN